MPPEAVPPLGPDVGPLLELRGVDVSYDGLRALSGFSLVVPQGSVVALLGANGAGKTTTLRAVSGLVRPDRGEIRFGGRRIDRMAPHRISRLGVVHVPEGRGIFRSLSVRANLRMATYAVSSDVDVVAQATEWFPVLGRRIDQTAGLLSGGEQQMLALARALLAKPRLVLLDEISMGLAPMIVSMLFERVRAMAATGVTVLLVEQYVETALDLADYAYVLDKGRLVDVGEPSDLRADGLLTSYLGV